MRGCDGVRTAGSRKSKGPMPYVRTVFYENMKDAYKRKYLILCIQDRFIKC